MPITDDVRKYRETVLEQGKVALERGPQAVVCGGGRGRASPTSSCRPS